MFHVKHARSGISPLRSYVNGSCTRPSMPHFGRGRAASSGNVPRETSTKTGITASPLHCCGVLQRWDETDSINAHPLRANAMGVQKRLCAIPTPCVDRSQRTFHVKRARRLEPPDGKTSCGGRARSRGDAPWPQRIRQPHVSRVTSAGPRSARCKSRSEERLRRATSQARRTVKAVESRFT